MQDSASSTQRGDLIAAAEDWLSHRAMNSAVPLSDGVAELRFRFPHLALPDQDLELLVAELALKRGLAICLDGRKQTGPHSQRRSAAAQARV